MRERTLPLTLSMIHFGQLGLVSFFHDLPNLSMGTHGRKFELLGLSTK